MDTHISQKIDQFFTQFRHQAYKKGEILIRADDVPSGVFYLKSGFVKKYLISKKGEELVVNVFKPISFFPMSWAINNSPNPYYYEAATNLDLWKAPREQTTEFVKQNPDVLYDLMSRVYKGTDGMTLRMAYLMAGNAYDRLITELIIHAKRFGDQQNKQVTLKVSEKDLAALSGMTRETVSREMKILKNKNLVTLDKNVLAIQDLDKLENELTEGI